MLGDRLEADHLQVAGDGHVDRPRPGWRLVEDPRDQDRVGTTERRPSAEHLVEDDTQTVDVAAAIDFTHPPGRLFGAHVGGRAEEVAILGQQGMGSDHSGQPEIQDERVLQVVGRARLRPPPGNQDVRGLDIAVHGAHLMDIGQRVREFRRDRRRFLR